MKIKRERKMLRMKEDNGVNKVNGITKMAFQW